MPSGPAPDFSAFLKGGRGTTIEPDQIRQKESFEVRRRLEPTRRGTFIGICWPYTELGTGTLSATQWRFLPVLPFTEVTIVDRAVIRISTASAGQFARAGIYAVQMASKEGPARHLRLVPGTAVEFSAASTGAIDVVLPLEVTLQPGGKYAIGVGATDAIVAARSIDTALSPMEGAVGLTKAAADELPSTVRISSLTKTGVRAVAAVIYYGPETGELWVS